MLCNHCGTNVEDGIALCPQCNNPIGEEVDFLTPAKRRKTRKKRPHMALRALLQFVSVILCFALLATLSLGVLLFDLHQLDSAGGIKHLINASLSNSSSARPLNDPAPQVSARNYTVSLSSTTTETIGATNPFGDLNIMGAADADIIAALLDYLYEQFQQFLPEELNFNREQFQSFIAKSTVMDYVTEKVMGYTEDLINGTENTQITPEEILELLDENEDLLESELGITLSPADKDYIRQELDEIIQQQDLNGTIREEIQTTVNETLNQMGGINLDAIRGTLQMILGYVKAVYQFLISGWMLLILAVLCIALSLMLCGANYYNLPAAITWFSAPAVLIGLSTVLPLLSSKLLASLVQSYVPAVAGFVPAVMAFIQLFAPVHCVLLVVGLVLFVGSILWRIIAFAINRKRPLAA